MRVVPALQGLCRGLGVQGLLGQVVVVERHVAVQGLFEIVAGAEVVRAQQVGDAAVEALHHAVGLRAPGPRQAVLDAERLERAARRLIMHHARLPHVAEAWVWLTEARLLLRQLTT